MTRSRSVLHFALKTQRPCGSRVQGSPSCGAAARMNLWKAELNKISHAFDIGLQIPCSTGTTHRNDVDGRHVHRALLCW